MTSARGQAVGGVRCPSCGALVGGDAEWCPQCFTSLRSAQTSAVPVEAPAHAIEAVGTPAPPPGTLAGRPDEPGAVAAPGEPQSAGRTDVPRLPVWACPVCGAENPLEADVCSVCATPFAQLLREDQGRESVDPSAAMRRSLAFPGLGHRMVGENLDGFVWGFLFVFVLAMGVLLLLARLGEPLGPIVPILGALVVVAVGIWIFTAAEAARLARGQPPLLPRNRLPWVAAGIVGLVLVLSLFIVMSASKTR